MEGLWTQKKINESTQLIVLYTFHSIILVNDSDSGTYLLRQCLFWNLEKGIDALRCVGSVVCVQPLQQKTILSASLMSG